MGNLIMNAKICLITAAVLGFLGVAADALGSHALKGLLEDLGTESFWQLAAKYQMFHALALMALAAWAKASPGNRRLRWVFRFWLAGVVLFSGSLYVLALGGPGIFGPLTPLGGLCLLAGWASLAIAAMGES